MDDQKKMIIGGVVLLAIILIIAGYMVMSHKKKVEDTPVVVNTTVGPVVVPSSTKPGIITVPVTTTTIPSTTMPPTTDTLKPGVRFNVGDFLVSKNGNYIVTITPNYKFIIKSLDGSLVYGSNYSSVYGLGWRHNDHPEVKSLIVDSSGIMSFTAPDGKVFYTTNTSDSPVPGSVLNISNDGSLCLISPASGYCVWQIFNSPPVTSQ